MVDQPVAVSDNGRDALLAAPPRHPVIGERVRRKHRLRDLPLLPANDRGPRERRLGAIPLQDGFSVAIFGVIMAFMSVVQLWMNQFAIDRAGLTLLCVQPLTIAAVGPPAAAAIIGFRFLHSPSAAVGLAAAWLVLAWLLHLLLSKAAVAAFETRRESLVSVAMGR